MNKVLIILKKTTKQLSFFSELIEGIIEKIEKYFPNVSAETPEAPPEQVTKKVKLLENAKTSKLS